MDKFLFNENVNDYLLEIAKDSNSIDGELVYNIISQIDCDNEDELLNNALTYLKDNSITIIDTQTEEFIYEGKTDNFVRDYINQISLFSLLSFEEECELSKRIIEANNAKIMLQDNPDDEELKMIISRGNFAKEKMANHNLKLVVHVAKRYITPGVDFMDLIQEGNMGLMTAINKYDYRLGFRFSTYAYNWIRQAISKFLRNSNDIKIPMNVQNDLSMVKKKLSELELELGTSDITPEMISNAFGGRLSVEKVKELLCLNVSTVSLDTKIGDSKNSRELHETIAASNESAYKKIDYPVGWDKLSEKEQDIFLMFYRYGISLADIGIKYNISAGRIRQIKDKTKRKLEFYSKKQ